MKELITAGAAAAGALLLWKKKRISGIGMLLAVLLAAAGVITCVIRGFSGEWIPVSSVERGEKGSSSRRMTFQVEAEDADSQVILEIPAVRMEDKEARAEIEVLLKRLDQEILGENSSLTEICYPLKLRSSYPDSAVRVRWQSDVPACLNSEGELGRDIPAEGVPVQITGELQLDGRSEIYRRQIFVFPSRAAADLTERIRTEADALNQDKEGTIYQLPEYLDTMPLQWYRESDSSGWFLICMAAFLLGGLVLVQQQRIREEQKYRKEQLDREYPELVSRMQMLLGAGLGMRAVLERIAREYRGSQGKMCGRRFGTKKKKKDNSPVYEEILVSCRELENGVSEAEVYRRLGERCGTPPYRGLSLLLEQNMTKGGQGLLHLLEQEALEAFENRQRRARQEGEKVSVRLLLPMGMMLVIVLALIMIPAFLSF